MSRPWFFLLFTLFSAPLFAADGEQAPVVFRSDVSLVRVDAQVVDRDNRTIAGLQAKDFVLLEQGKPQEIRNFSRENMPVDIVLLLDVSASMRPHVERIASAAHEALRVLGDNDRVAIMVFDRSTRLRMQFRNSREDVEREFEALLRQETFDGGTDITRGLIDAARYIGREGRRDARRAIVIVTDDQTERDRNEAAVERALTQADAVLSALIAPDAMRGRSRYPGGGYPGGGYPGGGGGYPGGGPLGGIIFGRRGPYGGRGGPGGGPVVFGPHTQSAGTSEIARQSGGDSMPVDSASALEDTLARLRQRYALHFYLPAGVRPGEERAIEVRLADATQRRYPNADVRYRRVYMAPDGSGGAADPNDTSVVVTRQPDGNGSGDVRAANDESQPRLKRRRAVNEPDGSRSGPSVIAGSNAGTSTDQGGGWRHADETAQPEAAAQQTQQPTATQTDPEPDRGGWRRATPEDEK